MPTSCFRRLAASTAASVVAATLAVLVPAAASTASAAPPPPVGESTECVDELSEARTRPDGAKDPNAISATQAAALGNARARAALPAGSVTIETVFHVITAQPLTAQEKARYDTMVAAQLGVLNDAHSGQGAAAGSPGTPFRFTLLPTTYTVNPAWASMEVGTKETKAAKDALHQGSASTLNVYVADLSGLLGYATFPQQGKGQLAQDGVVILDESMPGGTAVPYAEGDTLVHEAGHWLGLFHTFQGGCRGPGDYVFDTPAEAGPAWDCTELGRDSCPADAGIDPVQNFMDYADDDCMSEFTEGQARRMSNAWQAFRQ